MNSEELIWPNFFVVGAAKAGTTSLYEHLKKHPQVFLPETKEPSFFATEAPPGVKPLHMRCPTLDEYQRLYQGAGEFTAIGDLSTPYLWDEMAPRRIHEVAPQAKIIIVLRDPVDRAHSFYLMNLLTGVESAPTLYEALNRDKVRNKATWFTSWQYVEAGLYYDQVRRYIDIFGREQVLLLLFDDLAKNPRELFSKIAIHIGVDPAFFRSIEISKPHNYYRMPRFRTAYQIAGALGLRTKFLPPAVRRWLNHNPLLFNRNKPPVDDESRRFLQGIYGPDIARLEDLLGCKLPELRKTWV